MGDRSRTDTRQTSIFHLPSSISHPPPPSSNSHIPSSISQISTQQRHRPPVVVLRINCPLDPQLVDQHQPQEGEGKQADEHHGKKREECREERGRARKKREERREERWPISSHSPLCPLRSPYPPASRPYENMLTRAGRKPDTLDCLRVSVERIKPPNNLPVSTDFSRNSIASAESDG